MGRKIARGARENSYSLIAHPLRGSHRGVYWEHIKLDGSTLDYLLEYELKLIGTGEVSNECERNPLYLSKVFYGLRDW